MTRAFIVNFALSRRRLGRPRLFVYQMGVPVLRLIWAVHAVPIEGSGPRIPLSQFSEDPGVADPEPKVGAPVESGGTSLQHRS